MITSSRLVKFFQSIDPNPHQVEGSKRGASSLRLEARREIIGGKIRDKGITNDFIREMERSCRPAIMKIDTTLAVLITDIIGLSTIGASEFTRIYGDARQCQSIFRISAHSLDRDNRDKTRGVFRCSGFTFCPNYIAQRTLDLIDRIDATSG